MSRGSTVFVLGDPFYGLDIAVFTGKLRLLYRFVKPM